MKTFWLSFGLLILLALSSCASRREVGDYSSPVGSYPYKPIPRSDTPQILRDALVRKPTPVQKPTANRVFVYDTVWIHDTVYLYNPADPTEFSANKRVETASTRKLKREIETLKEENAKLLQHINSIATNSAYNTQNTQGIKMNLPIFSVQIAAYKYKLTNVNLTFATLSLNGKPVGEEYYADDPSGYPFKYVVGEFSELEDAIRYCKYINDQGIISGAFVVAYYNERRIKIKQATEIIERLRKY
jgi:hypothetical protein